MYETIAAWAGLGLLFILCLPFAGVQRCLLVLYGLGLRLGMIALVLAAGYLWFRPAEIPTEVADTVRNISVLARILPEPGTPIFAICLVSLIAVVLLPLIAVIDICRRGVGTRERVVVSEIVRVQNAPAVYEERPAAVPPVAVAIQPTPSRFGRRAAANAMAQAGSTR